MPINTKILIVEDDDIICKGYADELISDGFSVITAQNGQDGLSFALNDRPGLILLDILLPKLDGMSMLSKLRQDPLGKTVPVILLTNFSDVKNISLALKNNVTDYFIKSDWNINEVVGKIKEKLSA